MRILLIAPGSGYSIPGWIRIPQLSLIILKTLSGNGHQVTMVEEDLDRVSLGRKMGLGGHNCYDCLGFPGLCPGRRI